MLIDPAAHLRTLHSDGLTLCTEELLRYRSLHRLINLTPSRQRHAAVAGAYLSKHKGRGMEFDEARHYQAGDDIRAIDWRVTARTGKTHTKIYREERERPVFVLCDLSPSMQFGTQLLLKSIQAAHLTALISWAAAQRGDKVGALLFTADGHFERKPMARAKAVLAICQTMISLQQEALYASSASRSGFGDACARLRRLSRPGSLVYILSDFEQLDANANQHLAHIARHCETKAVMISDPLENTLPRPGGQRSVDVTDGSTRQTWQLGDRQQHKYYEQQRQAHIQTIAALLQQAAIPLQHISAGQPLEQQLAGAR